MLYDLIIIGSGPAGLSSVIYAQRAKLENIIIEKCQWAVPSNEYRAGR